MQASDQQRESQPINLPPAPSFRSPWKWCYPTNEYLSCAQRDKPRDYSSAAELTHAANTYGVHTAYAVFNVNHRILGIRFASKQALQRRYSLYIYIYRLFHQVRRLLYTKMQVKWGCSGAEQATSSNINYMNRAQLLSAWFIQDSRIEPARNYSIALLCWKIWFEMTAELRSTYAVAVQLSYKLSFRRRTIWSREWAGTKIRRHPQ